MSQRLLGYILLINIVLAILLSNMLLASPGEESPWWNKDWDFRKEIFQNSNIPIDTSSEHAHYQPVDIHLEFDNPCWAKNEEEHSVRVIFQDDDKFIDLESQIYDLNYSDDSYIKACNLVFLIPKEANGKETYYVYYDDEEKSNPNYQNHVDVGESYYRYESVPGLLFKSLYYKITEEDYIIYAVAQEGTAYNHPISQEIGKLKKETENIMLQSGEIAASFNFIYWWNINENWNSISTADRLVSKQIFVDGNLMVKFGIVSESADGLLRSTIIYKYYYCPLEDKRIYTHVKHEVVGYPLPSGDEIDVNFITLICSRLKSSNIEELNFGKIPPYLHFYKEDEERIWTYDIDQYPESTNWEKKIGRGDDYDLGSIPWLSVDYGTSGKAHAIIFESNNILKSGTNERDGIELYLYESNNIKLPGIDGRFANIYMMRNVYEKYEDPDEELPEDYIVEFNAEFFTTENGGYPTVEKEAEMYQSLIQYQPTNNDKVTDDREDTEKFNLTIFVHFTPSFPFGSLLSSVVGLNVSYLSAELFKENNYISSATANRLPLSDNIPKDFADMKLLEKIKTLRLLFDWKNFSLFKKIRFCELETGRYLIKIFRENHALTKERQFIGFTIVNLDKDSITRILSKPEGKISFSFLNQDKGGIENVRINLIKDNTIISECESDSNGNAIINAPCDISETYKLNITYKGFLINEDNIRLGLIRKYIPLKKTLNFSVYDISIIFRDSKGSIPSFDVGLSLTSDEMQYPSIIDVNSVSEGVYKINNLYPANYTLEINYDSFEVKEKINIPEIDTMEIDLHDLTVHIKDSWDLPPGAKLDVSLISIGFEKTIVILGEQLSTQEYSFSNLYPGNYTLKIRYKSFITEEFINIPNRKDINIVFPAIFNVTVTIFDSHGNLLKDARVLMARGETGSEKDAQEITDDNGKVIFTLPPGSYINKIYYGGDLIAKRKVEILNEKIYTIGTTNEPLIPFIIICFTIVVFVGTTFLSYRKKDEIFFLKILAILLIMLAIVSPWWAIHGESYDPYIETSTKLYLMPTKMVTITSNDNATVGELMPLDDNLKKEINILFITVTVEFLFVMDFLLILLFIGFIMIILSLFFDRYSKMRLSLGSFILAIIIYIGYIVVFFLSMSELANETVGGFVGNGYLGVNVPGEKIYETILSSWGPNIGFYLLLCSIGVQLFIFYLIYGRVTLQK